MYVVGFDSANCAYQPAIVVPSVHVFVVPDCASESNVTVGSGVFSVLMLTCAASDPAIRVEKKRMAATRTSFCGMSSPACRPSGREHAHTRPLRMMVVMVLTEISGGKAGVAQV